MGSNSLYSCIIVSSILLLTAEVGLFLTEDLEIGHGGAGLGLTVKLVLDDEPVLGGLPGH